MEKILENLVKNVKNVEQYTSVTKDFIDKFKNTNVKMDLLTTTSAITKVRSLEVEYFSKSRESGAACFLFERLLSLPPSKTWGFINKDLISSLQYWLQAITDRLPSNSDLWWHFLKLILMFIKEIRAKHSTMPEELVKLTAESLFAIATIDGLTSQQRHEILHCLNIYCTESGREIRFALRNKFNDYFMKVAWQLCWCGYLPLQFSALEALVRWLVPRGDRAVRSQAAKRWFPPAACPDSATKIFLDANWSNFFEDARSFLNALNASNGLVTSVVCKTLFVGEMHVITGAERQQTWLDINTGVGSVSVLMDPRVLACVRADFRACETLVIESGSTRVAFLHSESREITLSVSMYNPPRVQPCGLAVGDGSDVSITIIISSRTDLKSLDCALRAVFGEKYQVEMDLDAGLSLSPIPETRKHQNSSSEESRFSIPVEIRSRKRAGPGVAYKDFRGRFRSVSQASPSTASTSSLAQLHEKLAALPRVRHGTEYYGVCVKPQLSSVSEISETDDARSIQSLSTLKFAPYNVGVANRKAKQKAGSDSELLKHKTETGPQRSVLSEKLSTSCLLVATLGTDESVINDTIEYLSASKDFQSKNIVNLIVREALEAEIVKDSRINSDERNSQPNEDNTNAIENKPVQGDARDYKEESRLAKKKPCTIVSKSTTDDESNTEAILDTPLYVSQRRSKFKQTLINSKKTELQKDKQTFDAQHVEKFFSQHIAAANTGQIKISPTLARKINASSSNSIESFDENCLIVNDDLNVNVDQFEIIDIEVIECLNDMVDKVCNDLFQYLSKETLTQENDVINTFINEQSSNTNKKQINTPKKIIGKPASKQKKPVNKKSTKETTKVLEMSSSKHNVEKAEIDNINQTNTVSPVPDNSIVKRKRKLYSPKDDEVNKERIEEQSSESDNVVLANLKSYERTETPKTVTFYKDIERERKRYIRKPRPKKFHGERSPSPTTAENDAIFDKLKSTVENNEKLTFVDTKSADEVYNFTSGSEDADFEVRRIELRKRIKSKKTVVSSESSSVKTGKKFSRNYTAKSSNDESNKNTKQARKRPVSKKTNTKSKTRMNIESPADLKDEKMRKAASEEALNTSISVAKPNTHEPKKADLVLKCPPQMELISDDEEAFKKEVKRTNLPKNMKSTITLKKGKGSKNPSDKEDSGTMSPLPGLIVEAVPTRQDDTINIAAMGRKFQQICEEGPDVMNEISNTQNMLLSETEYNCPQNVYLNITDKIVSANKKTQRADRETTKKCKLINHDVDKQKGNYIRAIKKEKVSRSKNVENYDFIEIVETVDVESEKSISTNGIQAHANSDELPPSPGLLDKNIPLREMVDMKQFMRKDYLTLNRQLYDSTLRERNERSKEDDLRLVLEEDSKASSDASPHKPIDIIEMMPSRRCSDRNSSDSSNINIHENPNSIEVHKKIPVVESSIKHYQKPKATTYHDKTKVVSPKQKSPIVSVRPLTSEDINRWSLSKSLKAKHRSDSNLNSNETKRSLKCVYNTRKAQKKIINISDTDEDCEMNGEPKDIEWTSDREDIKDRDKSSPNTIEARHNARNESVSNSAANTSTKERRLSTISPININVTAPTPQTEHLEERSPIIRKVSKKTPKPAKNIAKSFPQVRSSVRSSIEHQSNKSPVSFENASEKPASSTMVEPSMRPTKRKLSSPILVAPTSMRNDDDVKISSGSGPSASSVFDWFRRNEISTQDKDAWAQINDTLLSMREKLDTSLAENNLNMSQKFVEFFVDVQNLLENQQEMCKTATEAATAAAAAADAAATALKKSKKDTKEVMENLKKNFAIAICKDSKQKNAIVTILKEDIDAVLDHVKRMKSKHT